MAKHTLYDMKLKRVQKAVIVVMSKSSKFHNKRGPFKTRLNGQFLCCLARIRHMYKMEEANDIPTMACYVCIV